MNRVATINRARIAAAASRIKRVVCRQEAKISSTGAVLDFSYDIPRRFPSEAVRKTSHSVLSFAVRLVTVGALMFDVAAIAAHLQDAETGKFTFSHLAEASWSTVSIVSIVALLLCAVYFLFIDGILREKRYVVRVAEEEARIAEEAAKIEEEAAKK